LSVGQFVKTLHLFAPSGVVQAPDHFRPIAQVFEFPAFFEDTSAAIFTKVAQIIIEVLITGVLPEVFLMCPRGETQFKKRAGRPSVG
jgi:hypothetical protein